MTDDKAYKAEVLEWALRYAEQGWRVFPCHSIKADGTCTCEKDCGKDKGKHPRITVWQKKASSDKAQIEKWFSPKAPLSNVAIVTGQDSAITVIDIDLGEGKKGADSWQEAIADQGDGKPHGEPQTLRQNTGGGGMHFVFIYNSALKTGTNVLGEHIDSRNDTAYILGAPSRHRTGGVYEWANWGHPLAHLPPYLSKQQTTENKFHKDNPDSQQYTLSDVRDMLAVIPADDRTDWRNYGVILGRYFARSQEAWSMYVEWAAKWQGRKGRNHEQIMHEAFYDISQKAAERELSIGTIVQAAQKNGWVHSCIQDMNRQYGVVWLGGDCVILREHQAPDTGLLDISFCGKPALKLFHAAEPNVGRTNRVEYWLRHPQRRTYHGLVFQPGPTTCDPSLYNLWQGFAVKPKEGDCSLYWAHLKDNICARNEELYRYVRAWMANVVQTPGNRPGVAIVLRGKQGTGKGVFAKGLGRLFAPHFAHITNSQQLVGRFNALLKKAVLVFADEAFWAGDKQAEGTLNALITEETHNIEPKGIDPFSVKNFMHLIVASNHEWVIPASSEARRWLVLDVSEAHLQDHDYFNAIDTQMKNGGSAALLYELLHHKYSDVDLWTVPKTAALNDQKFHSMTPVEKFWFGCLEAGSQIGGRRILNEGIYANDTGWQTEIRSAVLYDAYVARSQDAGVRRRALEMELAEALKRMVPKAEHKRMTFGQDQARGWKFPSLEDCRTAFDEYMRWSFEWEQRSTITQLGLYESEHYGQLYTGARISSLEMDV